MNFLRMPSVSCPSDLRPLNPFPLTSLPHPNRQFETNTGLQNTFFCVSQPISPNIKGTVRRCQVTAGVGADSVCDETCPLRPEERGAEMPLQNRNTLPRLVL